MNDTFGINDDTRRVHIAPSGLESESEDCSIQGGAIGYHISPLRGLGFGDEPKTKAFQKKWYIEANRHFDFVQAK